MIMVFEYHPDSDMLYIKLSDAPSVESEEVSPGVVLDRDVRDRVVGIEIEAASTFVDLAHLEILALPIMDLRIRESHPAS